MFKRVVDISASLTAIVLLAVPMLLIAVAIRLESPGKAVFRQRRAGFRGKAFTMFKFRTMKADVNPYGDSPHSSADDRLTKVGRFLRQTSLDELPQLFNVLAGSMSLVGPRPLYERQAELWDDRQRRRLDVLPGLTGYAQVYGRGELTIEEKIEMDLHYVEHRNWLLDARILLRTLTGVLFNRDDIYERQYSRAKERESDS
ncbi:MAG: sugar transferase [Planctomycetes bacterium]|jgi:lipopolysaccharide/colanic/teichoic acid biosynthesis glycosyltransferase|nr:sugar transferase [Planctomycetota bacterium]